MSDQPELHPTPIESGDPAPDEAPQPAVDASRVPPSHAPADNEWIRPSPPHPRSLKRRIAQLQAEHAPTRVRSQPLQADPTPPRQVREPVADREPERMTGPWVAKPIVVGLAIVAWIVAVALLVIDPARLGGLGLAPRVLVPVTWGLAAALTFVPIQLRLGIPGVGWQGVLGFSLLGYLLAFVPAPRGWLLDLPDLPVYLLLFFALFYAVAAAVIPLTYLIGQRFYRLRVHKLDVGRARRQAYEVGLLIVATLAMAALRVLSPLTFGLLLLVIVLTEALLLSQVQPEG